MHTDITIITLPRRSPHEYYQTLMPEGLARLKSSVEKHNFSCTVFDFDNLFNRQLPYYVDANNELDGYFREVIGRRYYDQRKTLPNRTNIIYSASIQTCINIIMDTNPKMLGVSIFSEQSLRCSMDFLQAFRQLHPQIPIVIGGYCMNIWAYMTDGVPNPEKIGPFMVNKKLTDYFIVGEGEEALVELLKGNTTYPGINAFNPTQVDLSKQPLPNYSDFNIKNYFFRTKDKTMSPMIGVTSSRGCVRNCVFCDINTKWTKYNWVEPQQLYDEIIHYMKTYKIHSFHWSDSIINASPPKLKKFCELMVDYYSSTGAKSYHSGQFIIRSEKQMPLDNWKLLKGAGFHRVIFGVESASQKVRWDMDKKFTNDDLHYSIAAALDVGITVEVLLMIGYPTETYADFMETVKFIERYKDTKNLIVTLSSFGWEEDWDETPLNINPEMYDASFDPIIGWQTPITNNYQAIIRTQALWKYMDKLGYFIYDEWIRENDDEIADIENRLTEAGRATEIKRIEL
jgi:radical SAM superfamily enzyme YgiQ (UPF0313 family)